MSNKQNASDELLNKPVSNTNNKFSNSPVSSASISLKRSNSWPQICSSKSSLSGSDNSQMRASVPGPSSSIHGYEITAIDIDTDDRNTSPLDYRAPNPRGRRRLSNSTSVEHTETTGGSSSHANTTSSSLTEPRNVALGNLARLMTGSLARRFSHSSNSATTTPTLTSASGVTNYASTTERSTTGTNTSQPNGGLNWMLNTSRDIETGLQNASTTTAVAGDFADGTPSGSGGGGGPNSSTDAADNQPSNNNVVPQLRVLLDSREAIFQYIRQNFTQFPNLHGFNVSMLAVLVLLIVFTQFFVSQFSACCAVLLAIMHYQDATRFMRCVSGASEIYVPLASVLLRNLIILYVLDKRFVFSVATFHNEIFVENNPDIFSVFYRVIVTELFVMDITLACKLLFAKVPFVSKVYKRRIYQWMEYTSALYRYPIPFVQWCGFINSTSWIIVYAIPKLFIGIPIAWSWSRTTIRLFRYSHLGTMPNGDELRNAEQCTICYSEFTAPIKLNCGHIFDSDCIRTWLDREVTCPICRATVSKEDNHYRNGNSIFPMHLF